MKKALLQINLAVVLWGFTGVLGRAISLDAPVLVWHRMWMTAAFMAVILFARRQWVPITRRDLARMILVGLLMGLHWVGFYGAVKFANISIAMVCLSTASVFTSIIDPWVNKGKHDFREVLIGLLAIAGVYLIYQFLQFYAVGIIMGVIAAILSSVFTMLNKTIAGKYPARTMVFYEMSSGWAFISLLLPIYMYYQPQAILWPVQHNPFDGNLLTGANDWIWLILLSLCCTVWAQSLALSALKHLSSFTATLSVNLEPVYGILLAFWIYNENKEIIFTKDMQHLNWGFIWGMALILLSVILQMAKVMRPKSSPGYIEEKGGID